MATAGKMPFVGFKAGTIASIVLLGFGAGGGDVSTFLGTSLQVRGVTSTGLQATGFEGAGLTVRGLTSTGLAVDDREDV